MDYILRQNVMESTPILDITFSEFEQLQCSREVLTEAFSIEEKYEIVVTNYLDVEKQLLETSATLNVRTLGTYADFFEIRSILNVRLVNLSRHVACISIKLKDTFVPVSQRIR